MFGASDDPDSPRRCFWDSKQVLTASTALGLVKIRPPNLSGSKSCVSEHRKTSCVIKHNYMIPLPGAGSSNLMFCCPGTQLTLGPVRIGSRWSWYTLLQIYKSGGILLYGAPKGTWWWWRTTMGGAMCIYTNN